MKRGIVIEGDPIPGSNMHSVMKLQLNNSNPNILLDMLVFRNKSL